MFVVVPVSEDDGELVIVRVDFFWRVQDKWSAKTVDVLDLERLISSNRVGKEGRDKDIRLHVSGSSTCPIDRKR